MDLFEDNIDLVKRIVWKMNYGYAHIDDLMQAGLMGLFYATKNYNDKLEVQFNTYATYYIIGEIKKELRNTNLIKLNKEIYKIINYINHHPDEGIDEISNSLGVVRENVLVAFNYKSKLVSLDEELDPNHDKSIKGIDLVKEADYENRNSNISDAVESLDSEEKDLIKLRYFNNYSQVEVANLLKKSQSKISRLEKKAISNLRRLISL